MNMKPSLGEFIRSRRDELQLTQRQVAIHVGFKSIAHLSDIEGGNRKPGPDVLPKLAEILRVPLDTLMDHDARNPIQSAKDLLEERPEMVAAFRRVIAEARHLTAEELIQRVQQKPTPPSADSSPPKLS